MERWKGNYQSETWILRKATIHFIGKTIPKFKKKNTWKEYIKKNGFATLNLPSSWVHFKGYLVVKNCVPSSKLQLQILPEVTRGRTPNQDSRYKDLQCHKCTWASPVGWLVGWLVGRKDSPLFAGLFNTHPRWLGMGFLNHQQCQITDLPTMQKKSLHDYYHVMVVDRIDVNCTELEKGISRKMSVMLWETS